jgi:hypothetical protein
MQDLYVWLNGAMFTGRGRLRADAQLSREASTSSIAPPSIRHEGDHRPDRRLVIFLLPYTYVVVSYGWPAVARSWRFMEMSGNTGGMPGLYVLKSFVIVFAVLVALQGIAMAARSILVLAESGRPVATQPALPGRDGVSRHGSRSYRRDPRRT